MMDKGNQCPVCAWSGLEQKIIFPANTFEICACCGTEFGLDVVDESDIISARAIWLSEGAKWFDDSQDIFPPKPIDWDIEKAKMQIMELKIEN